MNPLLSRIEVLEGRIAPAGLVNVNFAGGTLTINQTDNLAHTVAVEQLDGTHFRVFGDGADNQTDIDSVGAKYLDFVGVVKAINFTGGSGVDDLQLTRLTSLTSLNYNGGGGDNSFSTADVVINGNAKIDLGGTAPVSDNPNTGADEHVEGSSSFVSIRGAKFTVTGTLDIDYGIGENGRVSINANQSLFGGTVSLDANCASSNEFFANNTKFSKSISVDASGGTGGAYMEFSGLTTSIGKATNGESIHYVGKTGDDEIRFSADTTTLSGYVDFNGGSDGTGTIKFGSEVLKIGKSADGKSLIYASSTRKTGGGPPVTLTSADPQEIYLGGGSATLAGSIDFRGGSGDNQVEIEPYTLKLGKSSDGDSLVFNGNAGEDHLTLRGRLTLAGRTSFTGGGGENGLDLDGSTVTLGKNAAGVSISYVGGSVVDFLYVAGQSKLTVAGSIEFAGGGGLFDSNDTYSDSVEIYGGTVSMGKSLTGKSLVVSTADGATAGMYVSLSPQTSLKVAGSVEITGGGGDDFFGIDTLSGKLSGPVTFNGGQGVDTSSIYMDGTISGAVLVDLQGGGIDNRAATAADPATTFPQSQGFAIGGFYNGLGRLKLGSTLTVKSNQVTTAPGFASTPFEYFDAAELSVAGALSVTMGNGDSSIYIENLKAATTVDIKTGDGDNFLDIETGNLYGASVIKGIATITFGAGADAARIGDVTSPAYGQTALGSNSKVLFSKDLLIKGFTDSVDSFNDESTLALAIARLISDNQFAAGATAKAG